MAAAYLERAESILAQIVPCGRTVADNFAIYDDLFQWAEASRWFAFCGIIPAFAFAIFIELFNGGSPIPSGDQRLLFKAIEDVLYDIFKNDRNDHTVKIHECV